MKKILLINLPLLLSFLLINCGVAPEPEQVTMSLTENYANQNNDFAFSFLKKLDAEEPKTGNYFVSPMSLNIALGMLLNGADGKTKDEIQNTLKLGNDMNSINKNYLELIDKLPLLDENVTNSIANSVWYDKKFAVKDSYLQSLRNYFKASSSVEDFTTKSTVDKINNWANVNTKGKIPKVLDEIKPDQVMFLMNALYFKGNWKTPFKTENTYDADFNGISVKKSVKMMNMTENINYIERPNYKAVELPYGNGIYTMTIILPNENTNLNAVINGLSSTEWQTLKKDTTKQSVSLSMPKFTLSYEKDLINILSNMGMPSAFLNSADFSKMATTAETLKVGLLKQNAFVAVDEKGTEAAAVTTIGIVVTSVPVYKEFNCNRPFMFVISEKQVGNILYVGKIVNL